jgi:hypothetical protein
MLVAASAHADLISRSGESLPDTDARKAKGQFGAQMIFVANEDELFRRWATPSETVDLETINSVETKEPLNAFVVFGGCKPDKSGNCNVTVQYRVLRPDGKVYANFPTMEVWQGKAAPFGRSLELSVQYLKIVIEPSDQPGKYVVHAQIKDKNAGTVLKLEGPFIAKKAG